MEISETRIPAIVLYRGNEFAILRVFKSQKSPFTTKIAGEFPKHNLIVASNYGTFWSLVFYKISGPETDPLLSSSMQQALFKCEIHD